MIEQAAGISRDTAERLLARMQDMGLVREITGASRFRIWAARTYSTHPDHQPFISVSNALIAPRIPSKPGASPMIISRIPE